MIFDFVEGLFNDNPQYKRYFAYLGKFFVGGLDMLGADDFEKIWFWWSFPVTQ